MRRQAYDRDGLAPGEAAHASRRALGNVVLAADDARTVTFIASAAALVVVGVLAAWVAARRAARLDAVAVLREG